jgi:hypothetical protein
MKNAEDSLAIEKKQGYNLAVEKSEESGKAST